MAFVNKVSNFGDDTHIFSSMFTEKITDGVNTISIADIMPYISQWISGKTYTSGNFVIYNNILYYCLTGNSDTKFTEANWQAIGSGGGIVIWAKSTDYKIGDIVLYSDQIYKCLADHTSTDFLTDAANWQLESGAQNWGSETFYKANQIVYNNGKMYIALLDHISGTDFSTDLIAGNWKFMASGVSSPTWQANTIYSVGDLVYANEKVYICKVAHTSTTNFITDLIAGDWQVVANSVSNNMISDELLSSSVSQSSTGDTNFSLKSSFENYEYLVINYSEGVRQGSKIYNVSDFSGDAMIDTSYEYTSDYVHCYVRFTSYTGGYISIGSTSGGITFTLLSITGIRKETFNIAYTGTTYKTLWDSSTDGYINAVTSYTLKDDVNNYDFLILSHGANGGTDLIKSTELFKTEFAKSRLQVEGNVASENRAVNYELSGNTLTVLGIDGTYAITSIVGIKVNGYTLDYLAELSAPSDVYETISGITNGSKYTPKYSGYLEYYASGCSYGSIINSETRCFLSSVASASPRPYAYLSANKTYIFDFDGTMQYARFYYSVGSAKALGLI